MARMVALAELAGSEGKPSFRLLWIGLLRVALIVAVVRLYDLAVALTPRFPLEAVISGSTGSTRTP